VSPQGDVWRNGSVTSEHLGLIDALASISAHSAPPARDNDEDARYVDIAVMSILVESPFDETEALTKLVSRAYTD
jgi:hypothetical protein